MQSTISKPTLGRLPGYLRFIRTVKADKVSATQIAKGLGLGEVQVRKDLASVCAAGLPKVGYPVAALRKDLERTLKAERPTCAVVVGAGKLGTALMEYDGFGEYGMEIIAAFDRNAGEGARAGSRIPVYSMDRLVPFCTEHRVQAGILTVPAAAAQEAADEMVRGGLRAILNFAPAAVTVPPGVTVQQENIALSLAYLQRTAGGPFKQEEEEQYGNQNS